MGATKTNEDRKMIEAKFTKGPWQVTVDFDTYHEVGPQHERQTMITCDHNKYIDVDRNEALANAHLIAAAPEMYKMLESLAKMSSEDAKFYLENSSDLIDLLASARGEK